MILLAQRLGIYAGLQVCRETARRPHVDESLDATAPNRVNDVGVDQGIAAINASLISKYIVDTGNHISEMIDMIYAFEYVVDDACCPKI